MLAGVESDVRSTQSARTSDPGSIRAPDATGASNAIAHTPTIAASAIVARRSLMDHPPIVIWSRECSSCGKRVSTKSDRD
jgi:hypothetical protein